MKNKLCVELRENITKYIQYQLLFYIYIKRIFKHLFYLAGG